MVIQLVFETHSISEDNELGVATGWLPGRLSEAGKAQAHNLGARRPASEYDVVFTSDLHRSVETAEIAFGSSGIEVVRDWRLRECDYGDFNGMPIARLERLRAPHIEKPFPGGESYRQVVERVGRFLDMVRQERPGSRVVVIGHSATRWALDHLIHGQPLEALVGAPFNWQAGWEYELYPRATQATG